MAPVSQGFAPTMSASDSVMWTIERDPQLRSTVLALCLFDRLPDMVQLRARIQDATSRLPRLRQRVEPAGLGSLTPRWVDDSGFDPRYHFREIAAPDPGPDRWLLDFAGTLAEGGFDRTRPPWEIVVVGGLHDGAAALLFKLHHSLTDGVGGMQLLAAILDEGGELPPSRPRPGPVNNLARCVAGAITNPAGAVTGGLRTAASVARLLAPAGPRRSPVMVGHGTNWRYDTIDRPFGAFRSAAAGSGHSVNDVFVAGVTGGLRIYHQKHGRTVDALRVTLPVSIRRPWDPLGGNRFVPARFTLPVSVADPLERVRQTGEICRRWRHEPALPLTEAVAGVLNVLPGPITTSVMQSMLKGIDFVATNVPGMPDRCFLAGAEVTRFYGFAPLSGAAINVALISHADTACIGLNSDRSAVPDPDVLVACLVEGMDEVLSLGTGMSPGTGQRQKV